MGQALYLPQANKEKESKDSEGTEDGRFVYGLSAMQGWRSSMEDAHVNEPNYEKTLGLFGVFDGHGGQGVALLTAAHLGKFIKETDGFKKKDYVAALREGFIQMDKYLDSPEGRTELVKITPKKEKGDNVHPMEGFNSLPEELQRQLLGGMRADMEEEEENGLEEEEEAEKAAEEAAEEAAQKMDVDTEQEEKKDGEKKEEKKEEVTEKKEGEQKEVPTETATKTSPEKSSEKMATPEVSPGKQEEENFQTPLEDESELKKMGDEEDSDDDEMGMGGMPFSFPGLDEIPPEPENQGCTAVVVLIDSENNKVYCANAGDSRAVLSRGGKDLALSYDHKPMDEIEFKRITEAGGFVEAGRVEGNLNLSRALGDLCYKKNTETTPEEQKISGVPDIKVVDLVAEDDFIVMGCDGIWETTENNEMVDFVKEKLQETSKLSKVCEDFLEKCVAPDPRAREGLGCDNMSMMVIRPQKSAPKAADVADSEKSFAATHQMYLDGRHNAAEQGILLEGAKNDENVKPANDEQEIVVEDAAGEVKNVNGVLKRVASEVCEPQEGRDTKKARTSEEL